MIKKMLVLQAWALAASACACAAGMSAFTDHGTVAPVGAAAGGWPLTVSDSDGRPLIVMNLYAPMDDGIVSTFLFIDALTGEWEQINPGIKGLSGLSNYISTGDKFYATKSGYLVEVDTKTREWKRAGKVPGGSARSMTEGPDGKMYFGMWPNAELLIYDPETGELENHGPMSEEEWNQYPYVAVDGKGWVYASITMREVNLVGYNPATGERRRYLAEDERISVGTPWTPCYRASDGKVYARPGGGRWIQLYGGEAGEVDRVEYPRVDNDVHRRKVWGRKGRFPDGSELIRLDVQSKYYIIRGPDGKERRITFDYEGGGAPAYCATTGPGGIIYGSTGTPLRFFRYRPETGEMENWGLDGHRGHINSVTEMGGLIYGAVYSQGLICYDPDEPWEDANILESRNPRHLYGDDETRDLLGRPYAIISHPDGRHVVAGGIPYRVYAGGGIMIYDTLAGAGEIVGDGELLPRQGVSAIAALPDGSLVLGGTTAPGTGGTREAEEAEICVFDWGKRKTVLRKVPVPGARVIRGLVAGDGGIVYGMADNEFFVFDPCTGFLLHREKMSAYGTPAGRYKMMKRGPDGNLYLLFRNRIVATDPATLEHRVIGAPPEAVTAGMTISGGRLYFFSGRNLWSFDLGSAD